MIPAGTQSRRKERGFDNIFPRILRTLIFLQRDENCVKANFAQTFVSIEDQLLLVQNSIYFKQVQEKKRERERNKRKVFLRIKLQIFATFFKALFFLFIYLLQRKL